MNRAASSDTAIPRIESLKVKNFRVLRDIEIKDITPMTVLIGPNGSGKSTVLDVFAFLAECFEHNLMHAWDKRGRSKELKTRGSEGPVTIEIKYRERPKTPVITYHLAVDEEKGAPRVVEEWLEWKKGSRGKPFRFLDYQEGHGKAAGGETPDDEAKRIEIPLKASDLLAVNALGQLQGHPRVVALRDFIMGWHVSHLSADNVRIQPKAGPQEHLSKTGDNLANVIQYLSEQHPSHLEAIFKTLRRRIPKAERVDTEVMMDGRLLLKIKDAPFDEPILARFASDGTLKMLAYLVMLHDPNPPPFIGIEEPEHFLHPRLLIELVEECMGACERTQLFITTHSPNFIDYVKAEKVRILWRNEEGHTQVRRVSDTEHIEDLLDAGANLGDLWMEGYFNVGDPFKRDFIPVLGGDER